MQELPEDTSSAKTLLVFTLVLLGLISVGRLAMEAWMNRRAPRALPEIGARTDHANPLLIAIVDGLREASAWMQDVPEDEQAMPWLQAFARRGAWGIAIAGEPTLTAPCVRALLTGRRPDLLTGFRNFNARPVAGSVVGYLADRGARTAHGGDAAAFQFCRNHYRAEDVLQFPDQGPTDQGACDRKATPFVLQKVRERCTCVTLHLTGPDHAGHKWGATGREYWQACRTADGQIRVVIEAFLELHPDGTVLVAADHGVSSMGTHGGGEKDAKRAPFALVGPGVARIHIPQVDQCSLAPTLCALLGLPQPPLADAPPALELMALPAEVEEAALDAYVEARLVVARQLHDDEVDFIERKRAQLTVSEFADRVNQLLNPSSAGHAVAALGLSAAWLVTLVALISIGGAARRGLLVAVLVSGSAATVLALGTVTPFTAGLFALMGCVASLLATGGRWLPGAGFTLACLAALPVLTAGGITMQETFSHAEDAAVPAARMNVLLVPLGLLLLVFLRPGAMVRRLANHVRRAPGLVAAFGGVLLGFTLTLRPFIDPFVHLMILYAGAGCLVAFLMLRSKGARVRPAWERWAFAGVVLVLFLGTRIAEGVLGEVWVNATPMHDPAWLGIGVGLLVVLVLLTPRGSLRREDQPGLVLAGAALVLAYGMRFDRDTVLAVSMGSNALGLAALLVTLRLGTPEGRLLVRLLAGVALARRLSVMDAEFATFVLAAIGAALAARFRLPSTRIGLAWLAVGLVALRTAVFHAMGFEESFSTLDVGQAFAGLGEGDAQALDAAGGAVVTWQVVVAGLQLALRMALPWILVLAALARAHERTPGAAPGSLRCVIGDLAVSFGARGAAIATALWAWWRNSWWMTHAYTVYAYAAADVLLLLACATFIGAWQRRPAGAPASVGAEAIGAPAALR